MEREEIIAKLTAQYNEQYAGQGYPPFFIPHGSLTQCNFGGLLIILGNTGESCIVWSDWSDNALSHELTECEIDYKENPDDDSDEDERELEAYFTFQGTDYYLSEFMRIDYRKEDCMKT